MANLLPNVRPMPGDKLILIVPHYWAKGETVTECIANLETSRFDAWAIYSVHPDSYVGEMGGITYTLPEHGGHEPHLIADGDLLDVEVVKAQLTVQRIIEEEGRPKPPAHRSKAWVEGWEAFLDGKPKPKRGGTGILDHWAGWDAAFEHIDGCL